MVKRPRETFFQRRYTNGQHVHRKVSIINRDCKLKPQYKSNHYTIHFICVLIVYQLFIDKTGKIGTRIWIDISSSKICKFPMSTWKKRTASLATMECKLKPQWDTPSHLLRWLYSDKSQTSVMRMWKNQKPLTPLKVRWQSCFGNQSSSSTNGQVFLPCDPTMLLLGTYPMYS